MESGLVVIGRFVMHKNVGGKWVNVLGRQGRVENHVYSGFTGVTRLGVACVCTALRVKASKRVN